MSLKPVDLKYIQDDQNEQTLRRTFPSIRENHVSDDFKIKKTYAYVTLAVAAIVTSSLIGIANNQKRSADRGWEEASKLNEKLKKAEDAAFLTKLNEENAKQTERANSLKIELSKLNQRYEECLNDSSVLRNSETQCAQALKVCNSNLNLCEKEGIYSE